MLRPDGGGHGAHELLIFVYRYFLGLATESPKWPIDAVKKELAALQLKDLVTFAKGLNGQAHGTALIQVHPHLCVRLLFARVYVHGRMIFDRRLTKNAWRCIYVYV